MEKQDPKNKIADVGVKISLETPRTESFKIETLARDLEQDLKVQIVAMKAHFISEIFKIDFSTLQQQFGHRVDNKDNIYHGNNIKILKTQNSLLQQENKFIKHELQQEQLIIEKI